MVDCFSGERVSRVLVVRLSSLGDVILSTPVLLNLRKAYPVAKISFLTRQKYVPLLAGHPGVDEILEFETRGFLGWLSELRSRRWDVCVDLHDTWRSRLWAWGGRAVRRARYDKRAWPRRRLVWWKSRSSRLGGGVVDWYLETLSSLNVPVRHRRPELHVSPRESLRREWEKELGRDPLIGIAPGARHDTKRWPAERFAEAADRLRSRWPAGSPKVIIVGSHEDQSAAETVLSRLQAPAMNFVGKTSVRELMLLTRRCSIFLTNDSGPMHVADALGVPCVALFGPTVKEFGFFPVSPTSRALQVPGLYCRPCSLHGGMDCPEGHFRCLRDISVDHVVETAVSLVRAASFAPAATPK